MVRYANTYIYIYIASCKILTENQLGSAPGTLAAKEQMVRNSAIVETALRQGGKLEVCWLDIKKAYDSVPHEYIREVLRRYKIDEGVKRLIEGAMTNWKTTMKFTRNRESVDLGEAKVMTGIYQGDSMSPLLFIMALNPISRWLNKADEGAKLRIENEEADMKVNHLLYMDDIKLITTNNQDLQKLVRTVGKGFAEIGLNLSEAKCRFTGTDASQ